MNVDECGSWWCMCGWRGELHIIADTQCCGLYLLIKDCDAPLTSDVAFFQEFKLVGWSVISGWYDMNLCGGWWGIGGFEINTESRILFSQVWWKLPGAHTVGFNFFRFSNQIYWFLKTSYHQKLIVRSCIHSKTNWPLPISIQTMFSNSLTSAQNVSKMFSRKGDCRLFHHKLLPARSILPSGFQFSVKFWCEVSRLCSSFI